MLYNYYYTENWTFQHFRNFQNNVPTMFLEPKCVTWVDTIKIIAFIIREKKRRRLRIGATKSSLTKFKHGLSSQQTSTKEESFKHEEARKIPPVYEGSECVVLMQQTGNRSQETLNQMTVRTLDNRKTQ